ncbi:MAG: RNA pyrophosphohydrolase [Gammaproteobacteria bacterium]
MIDSEGFRANVGIILCNKQGQLFWARRVGQNAWQFPQGGIRQDESVIDALYRELWEETGLHPEHVKIMGCTRNWLRYRLPKWLQRKNCTPLCIGQKQKWFMLRMVGDEHEVQLDCGEKPEFDRWRWADYCEPLDQVVFFKRRVYARALDELAHLVFPDGVPELVREKLPNGGRSRYGRSRSTPIKKSPSNAAG